MIKSLLISLLVLLNFGAESFNTTDSDVVSEINRNFSRGDSRAIAEHFSNTIGLIINDEEDIYSRSQAEIILRDFFSKNKPQRCEQLHLIDKPNSMWYVFNLHTTSQVYRTVVDVNIEGRNYIISNIKIEPSVR